MVRISNTPTEAFCCSFGVKMVAQNFAQVVAQMGGRPVFMDARCPDDPADGREG